MAESYRIIRLLHDCHQADSRERAVVDVFADSVHNLNILSGKDEILDGTIGRLAVDPAWGEEITKTVALYKRERSLVYTVFFITGDRLKLAGRERKMCAPLIYYPVRMETEMVASEPMVFAVPDLSETRFNIPVLEALIQQQHASTDLLSGLLDDFPDLPFDAERIFDLAKSLEDLLPGLDVSELYSFPKLMDEAEVRRRYKLGKSAESSHLQCLPGAAFALIDNPPETRGVLYELATLSTVAEKDEALLSGSLSAILGRPAEPDKSVSSEHQVPALLSKPQQSALDSAYASSLTLLVGPPGTGKSFTSAAVALDHLARGQSVLFASKTQQSLDVIAEKLQAMLGTDAFVVRGGKHEYLKKLKGFIQDFLRGWIPLPDVDEDFLTDAARQRESLDKKISGLSQRIAVLDEAERSLGLLTSEAKTGFFSGLVRPFRRMLLRRKVFSGPPQWELMSEYQKLLQDRIALISDMVKMNMRKRMERVLKEHRRDLKHFLQALRARRSSRQERFFSEIDLHVLLQTFPVWMTTMTGAHLMLPMEREMFDLVIMDEATQCDMATCLPVFQRAKRSVVVGDPKQLRHISFLSRRRQSMIADHYEIDQQEREDFDYRQKSVLDRVESVCESQQQVVFLDEHFRSRPPIIAFSNKEFYSGALKVMTMVPGKDERGVMQLRLVNGVKVPAGANQQEAEALMDEVASLVKREESVDGSMCQSIGILSPFRDQVDEIRALAQKRLSTTAIEKHEIKIGTAYAFQGDERDVMFLSFAVDEKANSATFRYLNRPDVFNVSVTRARNLEIVYSSISPQKVPGSTLFGRFLSGVQSIEPPVSPSDSLPQDDFLRQVQSRLVAEGMKVYAAFALAGLELDLVAVQNESALGIDLIGYPGRFAPAFSLERYRMLHRAGMTVMPLPYSAWQKDQDRCIEAIKTMITPGTGKPPADG